MSGRHPPRWLEWIVEWALPTGMSGQCTLGDLAEDFAKRARTSHLRAVTWYAMQALSVLIHRFMPGREAASRRDSDLLMDIRWSCRIVRKHPIFAAGVVAVLGLGLGANVAVFSVVDGTLENTSWWADADATVAIWPDREFSFGQIELYADNQAVYRAVGGYAELAFALQTMGGESQSVNGVVITPQLFRELAVQPVVGRALEDSDALFGVEPVVVIGDGLWRRAFGADSAILGSRIDVGGGSVTVVGVQGANGNAPGGTAELWMPLVMDPRDDDFWKAQNLTMAGVLRNGADLDDAFVDLMAYTDLLSDLFPMFYPPGFAKGVASVARADEAQRRMVSTPLLLLFAGTALLLMVTALNVGNLLLGRAIERRREFAVRASLGAGRGRIVRQLLVEGFVLTGLAFALGLVSASFGGRWLERLFIEEAVVASNSVLSPSVLVFASAVSVFAWCVLNGVPITHYLRTQRTGLNVSPDSGAAVQRSLVTVQAALATLLLVSATLLVATVDNLRRVPLGFDADGMIAVELSPPQDKVESPAVARALYDRLAQSAGILPGVRAAGLTGWLPLRNEAPTTPINPRSAPVDPRQAIRAPMHMVDPGFFEVFGIEPLDGRLLGSTDRSSTPSAIVVNETLAEMLWPDGSAIGQMVAIDPHAWNRWAPVVGVVPDIRSGGITDPAGPALYVSLAESPARDVTLVVRATDAAAVRPALQRTVRNVDPLVPIRSVTEMGDVVRAAYSVSWVMMGLLIVLAGLATALGAIGIYGVLAHHVALTKKEIGVRMALGAQPGVVVAGVVRSGLGLAGLGIAIGSLVAVMSTRFLESLLFEVSTLAPGAFVAPALALAAAATLAAWIPAARAGRLPPAQVLRGD